MIRPQVLDVRPSIRVSWNSKLQRLGPMLAFLSDEGSQAYSESNIDLETGQRLSPDLAEK
jgi:hypothetical protein